MAARGLISRGIIAVWCNSVTFCGLVTATAAMMLPLVLGILSNLDVRHERNTFVFVLLGVAYSASIGGLGTPSNAIAAAALGLDFLSWMKYGIPIMVVLLPMMFVLMYMMLRPNLKHRFQIELEHVEWNGKRITAMTIFLLAVVVGSRVRLLVMH